VGTLITKDIVSELHEFSKFMKAWSSVVDESTIQQAKVSTEFFLKMADSCVSEGRYAEAIDIYNKLFENIPIKTSVLQRAKEMESLLTIIGKGKQGTKWFEKFLNGAKQDKMSFSDVFPILPIEERRTYERIAFVKPLRFYVTFLDAEGLEKVYYNSASIDISKEGLSIITDCILVKGDVVFFEPEIKVYEYEIVGKSAIVRWVKEIERNRYRIGLMFI
jgi:hypothetical protein